MNRHSGGLWPAWQDAAKRPALAGVMVLIILATGAAAAGGRAGGKSRQRSAPPTRFDKATTDTFIEDAFTTLQGPRPAFATAVPNPESPPGTTTAGGGTASEGFRWSRLVSPETLVDEVKDRKASVAAAVARPSDFKGGGYDEARQAFGTIALAFGIVAAYDQDIRWKKDAVQARDAFARVGSNCKVGTDQSYAESRARLEDLETMLEGGAPQGKADREDDFRWHQVAGRPALMSRLEAAEEVIGAGLASRGDFERGRDAILHDAEIVAAIGEVIQQPDFEDHDDESYRGYSSAMRDAAVKIRDGCRTKDYESARAAASELKKSCDACHGDYRN